MSFNVVERAPSAPEYAALRAAVGWPAMLPAAAERGLANALYSVCAVLLDGSLIGCARLVGDGGLYYYLQDVIVLPAYQRQRVGSALTEALLAWLARNAHPGAFVGLMAAEHVSEFYRRYGFAERPPGRPGMFRVWS